MTNYVRSLAGDVWSFGILMFEIVQNGEGVCTKKVKTNDDNQTEHNIFLSMQNPTKS